MVKRNLCKFVVWMASFFKDEMKHAVNNWGREIHINNSKTVKMLGVDFRKVETSLWEMGDAMIDSGLIPDRRSNSK